jgi:hypothetical protein
MDLYREHLRRLLNRLALATGIKRRVTVAEFHELLQLAEMIVDYGRMAQTHHGYSAPYVIVELPELALRFRERTKAITDALRLLREMGRVEPFHLRRCWKVQLADPLLGGRKMPWQSYEQFCINAE